MERETKHMRGPHPFVFTNLKTGDGVAEIVVSLLAAAGL